MFTKTGLRPREAHSLDARSGIGKKLPRVTATRRRDLFQDGGGSGVTAMSSIRRKKVGGRSSSSIISRGRREVYRHGGGGGGGGGGGSNRSRSQSAGRKREVSNAVRADRLTRKRPEWDDSLRDTSQYRLTAEEALRRKMSLVSKHNTLVFGLGGGGGSTSKIAAAATSSSVGATAAAATATSTAKGVARRRSSKQQQLQQQQQQQSRKARDGDASAVGSGSSLSAIYGGGRRGCKGKVAVFQPAPPPAPPPAPADADLTVAISEEGGEPGCAGGINDATMSLYTKHGGGGGGGGANAGEHQDGDNGQSDGGGESGGSSCGGDGGDVVDSTLLGGGGSASGTEAGGASSLAHLEVGIKAFSERVGRLEVLGKAGLLEESTAGKRRSGTESESEDQQDRDETDCRSHQSGDVSPRQQAAALDGLGSDDPLSRGTPRQHDGNSSSGQQLLSTATEHGGGSEAHHRHHGRLANPWSHGAPSSKLSFREQRRRRAAAAAQPFSTSGGGGGGGGGGGKEEEVGLVKRIELLEARVLGMCSASSPVIIADSTTSSTADSSNQDQEAFPRQVGCETTAAVTAAATSAAAAAAPAPGPGPGTEHTAREEQLRGVVVGLLSLSGALLERATSAERRLRELVGRGRSSTVGGVDSIIAAAGSDDVFERARRVRASAEAAVVPAGDGDDSEVVPATTTATESGARTNPPAAAAAAAVGSAGASAGAPPLPQEVARPPSGGRPRRVSPSPPRPPPPPPLPRRGTATSRSATTDCWGEALDAVGRLVDSQPSGSGFGLLDETAADEPSSVPSSPPPQQQQPPSCLSLPPTPMGNKRVCAVAAAAAAVTTAAVVPASPNSDFAKTDSSLKGQMLPLPPPSLPPPPQSAGGDNSSGVARLHRWNAAPQDDTALFLLDGARTNAALATGGGEGGTDRYAHILRPPWSARQELGWPVGGGGRGGGGGGRRACLAGILGAEPFEEAAAPVPRAAKHADAVAHGTP